MLIKQYFKFLFLLALFSLVSGVTQAQINDHKPEYEDVCYVYLVDVAKAEEAMKIYEKDHNPEALKKAEVTFPKIFTTFEEEKLTIEHYNFPNSKLTITANVYYTDESLVFGTSMAAGIAISDKSKGDILGDRALNAAIVEVSYSDKTEKFAAKQYVKIAGRIYLIGIECDCAAKRKVKVLENSKPK